MKRLGLPFFTAAPSSRKAFTLMETVVAMGIVSFAMIGILGLVPLGLNHFREAISFTAESQIIRSVSNDILLTDYDQLLEEYSETEAKNFYFSDEGLLLKSADDPSVRFTVTVLLSKISAPQITEDMGKTVLIEIRNVKSPKEVKKYSLVVPKG